PIANAAGCRTYKAGTRFDHTLNQTQADEINTRFCVEEDPPFASAGQRVFHFADARNYATTLASNDFVIHVAASDTFVRLDIDAINELIKQERYSRFIYQAKIRFGRTKYQTGSHDVSWFYDRRAFNWQGHIHETIYPHASPESANQQTITLPPDQLTTFHRRDLRKSREQYLSGLALDLLAGQNISRTKLHLALELINHNRIHSAVPLLIELGRDDNFPKDWRATAMYILGKSYHALGQIDQAVAAFTNSYWLDSKRRGALLELAEMCEERSNFQGCVAYAKAALSIPRTSPWAEDDADYLWRPHALLYWSLFWLGQKEEARRHWERCIEIAPRNPVFRKHAVLFGLKPVSETLLPSLENKTRD